MARLADVPPETARDFIRGILERNTAAETAWKVQLHMTIEESRLFWAADRYLELYETIGAGVEETAFTIVHIRRRLGEIVAELRLKAKAEDIWIELSARDLVLLKDCETQLDRYSISSKFKYESKPAKGGKKR